jgi:hypothetical protein
MTIRSVVAWTVSLSLSACSTANDTPGTTSGAGAGGQASAAGDANPGGANSGSGANFGGSGNQSGSANTSGTAGTIGLAGAGTAGAGGAAGTAGAAGAGGATGGGMPTGGAAACVTSGTELCEDFETGQLDLQKWKVVKPTASAKLAVDDTRAHRGKYALHIQLAGGGQSTAQIADAITFPANANTFYTRAYFYFSPDLPSDDNGGFHMAYLLATGNNDLGFVEAGLGSSGKKNYLGYSEYYGAGPNSHNHGATFTEFGPRSQKQITPMQWLCLELLQGGDATTTTRRIWVDGSELTEQKSNYTDRKPPTFELMSIGVLQYHPTTVLTDVWVDDIRVSKQPIGCDL